MLNTDELRFDERGLIPAIVVDAATGKVLTLAYMNRKSLEITMAEGRTCFWSRSRQELWRKGETSGNVQRVVDITADCDRDALVVRVLNLSHEAVTGSVCLSSALGTFGQIAKVNLEERFLEALGTGSRCRIACRSKEVTTLRFER